MFILAIIAIVIAVLALAAGTFMNIQRKGWIKRNPGRDLGYAPVKGWIANLVGAILLVIGVIFLIFSTTYIVGPGESKVLKDWTGVVDETPISAPGMHMKAPWQDVISWNVRNQDVMFTGDGTTSHNGQQVSGSEITFIDKDGVTGNMDIQVIFSIKPDKTVELTKSFVDQNDFEIKVVENDAKALPRDVASTFTTVDIFEERTRLKAEITEQLAETWADKGVIVENVNIHGIRYPEDVQQRFKDAQNAQTELLKAETEAETAKTKAEGEAQAEIAKANGEAEANRILTQSLTPQVLQQRWIDAIKGSGTIIVPQDFTSLGNLTPQK